MMRIMVIGPSGSGKTTLLHKLGLTEDNDVVRKTPSLRFFERAIDTPGEFFDLPRFYHVLITTSSRCAITLLLVDPTNLKQFPSRFVRAIRSIVIGVINKADLAKEDQIEVARKILYEAGVMEVVCVSALTGEGLTTLKYKIGQFIKLSGGV